MSSILRRALEAYDSQSTGGDDDKMIVMKGPLSELYTQALNRVYAKEAPAEGVVATESQANDQLMMQALASDYNNPTGDGTGGATTVYGVSAQGVGEEDLVSLTQALGGPDEMVLIIDGTDPGPNAPNDSIPTEQVVMLKSAMESMVLAHKGRVYHSLQEFASSRRKA